MTDVQLSDLAAVIEDFSPFPLRLVSVEVFEDEGVVYLAPESHPVLLELWGAVTTHYPQMAPYGGAVR